MPPISMRRAAPLVLLTLVATACESSTAPAPAEEDPIRELRVDAADQWAFVSLGDPAEEVQVGDPSTSAEWHIGFFASSVMLNGGDAGPGGVQGFCVCDNEGLSDAQVAALTDDDGLAAFEAVTASDVPADEGAWEGDALVPVIDGWWSYDFTTHTVSADPSAVFLVRTAAGVSFAKLHVTGIAGATQQHAGTVTLEFAVQPGAGEPLGPVQTLEVDVSGGAVAVDLETGSLVTPGADGWDLELSGYTIRVNGGVSGDAEAGASRTGTPFDQVTDPGALSGRHYRGDAYGGVFATEDAGRRWYRYNLQGGHQIWPTYNVYLIRVDGEVYKVQLTGYYHPETGDSRHVTFRYELLGS